MNTGIFFLKFRKQCGLSLVAGLTAFYAGNYARITSRRSGRNDLLKTNLTGVPSDYEQSPFFLRDSRPSERRARVKITPREKGETRRRGVIFTRARLSLGLLSLRKNGDCS